MKRLYLAAAVVGLWSGAPHAQEGLAPTAPVVPAPVLQNGKVQTPAGGGWGAGESRAFSAARWSPFRNPATAGSVEPVSASYAPPATYAPPLPAGITNPVAGDCGPGGCGGRDRSCWAKVKALLCFHYSPGGPPMWQPTPYRTSLIGQFPCTPVGGAGCASGCATASAPAPVPYGGPAMPAYNMPAPAVGRAPASPTAGAVAMPARGAPSPVQPTWQGRVTPEGAAAAKPAAAPSGVVPTGFKYPAPAPSK